LLHEEIMDRVIGDPKCKTKKYICCEHEWEVVEKGKTFTFNGKTITRTFQLTVPVGAGMKSSLVPSQTSKGLGGDRALRRQLALFRRQHAVRQEKQPGFPEKFSIYGARFGSRFAIGGLASRVSLLDSRGRPRKSGRRAC